MAHGPRDLGPGEVVCHGDPGPWNTVWDGDRLVALIDWDLAEPAAPERDVAAAAYSVVPVRNAGYCVDAGFATPPDRAARLRTFCAAYGADAEKILFHVAEYLRTEIDRIAALGSRGVEPWATFRRRGDDARLRADIAGLERDWDSLLGRH